MKKKIQTILAVTLAVLLTACSTSTPTPAPAVSTPPANIPDTTMNVLPDDDLTPADDEQAYALGCREDGMLYIYNLDTGEMEPYVEYWTPLTRCRFVADSNPEGSPDKKDVLIDDWRSVSGAVCPKSTKFWVVDRPGYNDTEWIEFDLDENYDFMSGTVVLSDESEEGAQIQVNIYIDETLAFSSQKLAGDQDEPFLLDVTGANVIRIECVGHSYAFAHGIVTSAVF